MFEETEETRERGAHRPPEEVRVPKRRRVSASAGRKLGALMFFGSLLLPFLPVPREASFVCSLLWASLPIIIGLAIAEDIDPPES